MMWLIQKASQFFCLVLLFLTFQTYLSSSSSLTQSCSRDEASALIQFKGSLSIIGTSSSGCDYVGIQSYPKKDSWKEGTDCCSWDGVSCDDTKGHVIGLDLSCSWLYGTIPSNSSLFHLPYLQKLNLAFNDFSSSMMLSKFGEFASLVYLNLSTSNFMGQVPSQVSHLSKLVSLDLSHNYDQTFDKRTLERLVHNLTEVREIFLDANHMSSVDPNVFMNLSSSLMSFSLQSCDLRGKFPENIFRLPNLKLLKLGYNSLILSLPKFNWSTHLEVLDVPNAIFPTRGFHESIGNLISLKHLNLQGSQISGSFPMALGNLSRLDFLDFYTIGIAMKGNEIEVLKIFTMLTSIDLSNNTFQGEIPKVIGKLSSLKGLNLSHNNLSGCIPTSVGNLINLEWLDLSSNRLVGTIPERLTDLTYLSVFNVSKNQLEGRIPQGKQFNTFGNDSYEGNNALCGFPVSKSCINNEPPPPSTLQEDQDGSIIAFGWKVVLIGYGCGVVFGLVMGYVVFLTGKPKWFVTLVEDRHGKRRKTRNRRGGGRRS
ncbi:hypothetical protein DITRI_Ditri01bG0191700 [Diplodiscus trichospermus]